MKKKRTMILVITLVLTIVFIGTSYAYFTGVFDSNNKEDNNTLNTETLSDTVMISDVEDSAGSFTASRIYPGHKEVASIKVNVTGKINSKIGIKFIYDVEENGMNDHIKISIYKSKKKIETKENYFNCKTMINTESETAKYYETCEERNLELLIGEKILHGGKEELDVVTDTILIIEEENPEEYYYYAVVEFINIEASQNEDMDKVLKGKINVEVVPPEKKTFEESVVAYGKLGNNIAKSMLYSSYLDQENLLYDKTVDNNLRYVGVSPNNYVLFNDELWRVIGVMNNVEDGTGKNDARVKLIREESIGNFSMDSSSLSVNAGQGVNEWSESKLMKLLNPGYESEVAGGSLYWNQTKGTCYVDKNYVNIACDFTNIGIHETYRKMIDKIKWKVGSNGKDVNFEKIPTNLSYDLERSENTGKICSGGSECNDLVERTTIWIGHIALLYPSDLGYATTGGETTNRTTCLSTNLYTWYNPSVQDCKEKNWLFETKSKWTMMPVGRESSRTFFAILDDGSVDSRNAFFPFSIFPTLYLKQDIQITNGNGTKENPYILKN